MVSVAQRQSSGLWYQWLRVQIPSLTPISQKRYSSQNKHKFYTHFCWIKLIIHNGNIIKNGIFKKFRFSKKDSAGIRTVNRYKTLERESEIQRQTDERVPARVPFFIKYLDYYFFSSNFNATLNTFLFRKI